MNEPKKKRLTEKQMLALELMTSGLGMKYKDIAEAVGVDQRTIFRWRHESKFAHFQDALKEINDARWDALADAARASAMRLVAADNASMTQFILKNEGYNPIQKVEADVDLTAQVVFIDDM